MVRTFISRAATLSLVCLAAGGAACAGRVRAEVAPAAPATSPAQIVGLELIGDLKDFAEELGSHSTENFLGYSDRRTSDNRCYFTGKLELPEFYSTLRMVREDGDRCAARSAEFDVFFYPVEAVASGHETITVALAEATTERLLVVVPHEDFHNQREARKAPTEAAEAAATLVGFLTASAFAKQQFGAESSIARVLERDPDLFLRKAVIVNDYYDKVKTLYEEFRSGSVIAEQVLERKAALYEELRSACSAIWPDPASFNKCPAALNNAGLAFDRTYTRHYPMVHQLYESLGGDTAALVSALKRLLENWPSSAARASEPANLE